jgi:hypothetical protein
MDREQTTVAAELSIKNLTLPGDRRRTIEDIGYVTMASKDLAFDY